MTHSRIERNIPKNYLFTFLGGTSLSEAIWMLYLAYRGLSLVQIGLVESIFHGTSLLMEVPTGIIADRFGRKTSRILGRCMAMVGTLLMISSRSFWGFALAFFFIALSYNLESGAGDALVYDSLVQAGLQDRYTKVKGRQEVSWQGAQIVSLVASGIVATFDYTLAYVLSLGIQATSLVVALTFEEPRIGTEGPREPHARAGAAHRRLLPGSARQPGNPRLHPVHRGILAVLHHAPLLLPELPEVPRIHRMADRARPGRGVGRGHAGSGEHPSAGAPLRQALAGVAVARSSRSWRSA